MREMTLGERVLRDLHLGYVTWRERDGVLWASITNPEHPVQHIPKSEYDGPHGRIQIRRSGVICRIFCEWHHCEKHLGTVALPELPEHIAGLREFVQTQVPDVEVKREEQENLNLLVPHDLPLPCGCTPVQRDAEIAGGDVEILVSPARTLPRVIRIHPNGRCVHAGARGCGKTLTWFEKREPLEMSWPEAYHLGHFNQF